MFPIAEYKYLGILAFTILFCGLLFVLRRWPQGKHFTFSQHVAAHKTATVYYAVLFAIVLPMLLAFFLGWFQPTFHLSYWFSVFIFFASVAQLLATLIPETQGWKVRFHRFISGLSGVLLIPTSTLVLLSDSINVFNKIATVVGILIMVCVICMLIVSKKETFTPSFIHQSIYYAAFFVPILIISYL